MPFILRKEDHVAGKEDLAAIYQQKKDLHQLGVSDETRDYLVEQIDRGNSFPRVDQSGRTIFLIPEKSGESEPEASEGVRRSGHDLFNSLKEKQSSGVQLVSLSQEGEELYDLTEGLVLSSYRFSKYFTQKESPGSALQEVKVVSDRIDTKKLKELDALIRATFTARDLVNEPLSYLTAEKLGEEIQRLSKATGFTAKIHHKAQIETLRLGGLLAVNKGSEPPPTFSVLEWKPDGAINEKPIVLVGKGIVYDTGGMSLKGTAGSMDKMKSDMGGAAAVVGAFEAIAREGLPIHVVGLIPATDNRPAKNAYVPGDVITQHDGTTVEVMNTDAEGRLVLADALSYSARYEPELVIDLATLTGSSVMTLGSQGVVAMGTASDKEFAELEASGFRVHERVVRLPLWKEYEQMLKSDIADVKNVGGRVAGAIVAGKFLERFTDSPWMHMDIAGMAYLDDADSYRGKGGTGVGVRLLYDLLKKRTRT